MDKPKDFWDLMIGWPGAVVILIFVIFFAAMYGYKFLKAEREAYKKIIEEERAYFKTVITAKDLVISEMMDKIINLVQIDIEARNFMAQEIKEIKGYFSERGMQKVEKH